MAVTPSQWARSGARGELIGGGLPSASPNTVWPQLVLREVWVGGYVIEKFGQLWKLTYPDGGWQRTRPRREAERLAALHAEDYPTWVVEIRGGGAGLL